MKARGVGDGGQGPFVCLFSFLLNLSSVSLFRFSSSSTLEVDNRKFLKDQ